MQQGACLIVVKFLCWHFICSKITWFICIL